MPAWVNPAIDGMADLAADYVVKQKDDIRRDLAPLEEIGLDEAARKRIMAVTADEVFPAGARAASDPGRDAHGYTAQPGVDAMNAFPRLRTRIGAAATTAVLASCLPVFAAARQQWTPVGLCGGGGLFNPVVSPHDPKMMMVECDMGARYISHDGGKTWKMIHHRQIGSAVRGAPPLLHPTRPGVIYALSGYQAATLFVSRDNGRTWKRLDDDRQPQAGLIARMYIDRARPQRLFIATGAGEVLFTDDEGRTWRKAGGTRGRPFHFVADRTAGRAGKVYFLGTTAGVFRSEDGGKTFVPATSGLPAGKPLTGFAGGSDGKVTVLYASVPCWLENANLHGGVYVSTDGGKTWRRRMTPKINVQTKGTSRWRGNLPQYSHFVANDVNPRRAYVACSGTSYFPPNHNTIYRTDDAGDSWTDVFFVDPRFKQCNVEPDWMTSYRGTSWVSGPKHMEISPTDPDTVMRADGMFLFFTRNAGRTWLAGHAVKATDATDDRLVTWKNNGLVVTTTWHYYVDPHQPNRHYIAYTDIGFARSLDGGVTWRWWGPGKPHGDDGGDFPIPRQWINTCYELAFDPDVPGKIWGAFSGHHDIPNENSIWRGTGKSRWPGGVCLSRDFGVTWKALRTGLPEKPALSVVLDPTSPTGRRTLYVAIYDHGVYKSTDDGATWVRKSKGLGDPVNMRICRLILHRDGTLFALITGMRIPAGGAFTTKGVGLYRSTDAAETWTLVNRSRPLVYPKDFAVDPDDSKVIFIGACDGPRGDPPQGGLYRSADGGMTWKRVLRKRPTHFGAYFHPKRKGWIYATCCGWSDAPEGSLFLSTDAGRTWRGFPRMPFAQINRIDFDPNDPNVIYACTFGGSVWKGPAQP